MKWNVGKSHPNIVKVVGTNFVIIMSNHHVLNIYERPKKYKNVIRRPPCPQEENSLDVETEHIHTQNSSHAHYRARKLKLLPECCHDQQWNWPYSTSMPHFNRI